jgi:hypothetical protein
MEIKIVSECYSHQPKYSAGDILINKDQAYHTILLVMDVTSYSLGNRTFYSYLVEYEVENTVFTERFHAQNVDPDWRKIGNIN